MDTVKGWFTRPETFYLFGAGCSRCANKPLIDELTRTVVADLSPQNMRIFENLKAVGGRDPTIEDLMTHLTRMLDIISSIKTVNITDITVDEITGGISCIRKRIAAAIGYEWSPSRVHSRFFARVAPTRGCRDIFSLNYDTVIEASLEDQRISYTDGFRGAENAYFEPSVYTPNDKPDGVMFRLFKVHGSINWIREDDGIVRRRPLKEVQIADTLPSMVYPSELKFIETRFGVYERLLQLFRDRMREHRKNNTLICLGYSFNDEHINNAIVDAICGQDCNLTVIALLGAENDYLRQQSRLTLLATTCPTQINFFVGSRNHGFFIGDALDEDASKALLARELWKFENVTNFLCGVDGDA